MQTKFVKYSAFFFLLMAGNAVIAQEKTEKHRTQSDSYIISNDEPGKTRESIRTVIDNTAYKLEMVNEKLTELYVDGKLIPVDQYGQYETVTGKIKEQIRLYKLQAIKDQEQAMRDQKQAKLNQEQAMKDQANAKLSQEQADKDQKQAKLNQERAMKDQARAKIDQKLAEEDQRMLRELVNDLIKDGIITDEKSLVSLIISSTGMTINDKKQPDEIYKKYKEKYPRFATGNFSYSHSPDGNKTMRMHQR